MKFKNSNQRKAVMAQMRVSKKYPNLDFDGDGVSNKKDCQPFNYKEQGFMHGWQIKRLKAKEEQLEKQREKEQEKLEDLKDTLGHKLKVVNKQQSIKQAQLRQKQAIIDEINTEKQKAQKLKDQSEKMQAELDKYTFSGKAKKFAKNVFDREVEGGKVVGKAIGKGAKATATWWNTDKARNQRKILAKSSVKVLRKTAKFLQQG